MECGDTMKEVMDITAAVPQTVMHSGEQVLGGAELGRERTDNRTTNM